MFRQNTRPPRGQRGGRSSIHFLSRIALLSVIVGMTMMQPSRANEEELRESGTIDINQVQVALFWSANLGGGTLTVDGQVYEFTIGGLGVGGIGASSIEATGTVYNMDEVSDIEGAYGQARYGAVAGDLSTGELWLQNPNGVYIHLEAKRAGLALALGADGVFIALK